MIDQLNQNSKLVMQIINIIITALNLNSVHFAVSLYTLMQAIQLE